MVPKQPAGWSYQVHVLGFNATGLCASSSSLSSFLQLSPGGEVQGHRRESGQLREHDRSLGLTVPGWRLGGGQERGGLMSGLRVPAIVYVHPPEALFLRVL